MKIKKIGSRWFALDVNDITSNQWVPLDENSIQFLNDKFEDGEHETDLCINLVNHGPKCSALWPNLNHHECNGTGMIAEL